jgi:ribosomal protein S12 methylthiotransferase
MAPTHDNTPTVGFIALGCPKNVVDSEKMLAHLAEAGFLIAADPNRADVVIINTCGFIEPAKVESLEAVQEALESKQAGTVGKVVVTGCLSQRLGHELLDEAAGVDAVVGLDQRDNIAQVIRDTLAGDAPTIVVGPTPRGIVDDRARLRIGPAHSAYLRISEGCNHRCAFCTIPAIRGPFRSKPPEQVLAEARELVDSGAVELNLIGQDTTLYGRDLKPDIGLPSLLRRLQTIDEVLWVRLMYAYPTGITNELLETLAGSEKVVRYLDVPIQHASDKILRAMRRPDTRPRLQSLIEHLRATMSDIVLRTTVIVGFPGETDEEFDELLEFVTWAQFDALGAFTFYPEQGTPAAELPNQVPDAVKQERLDVLMRAQQDIAFARNDARVGQRLSCLIDALDSQGFGRGRFYGQALDIDSICIVKGCSAAPGQCVDVEVVGTRDYDLVVEQV